MSIKSWRDVIHPHDDVLEGDFQAASFAADLTKVVRGDASREYQEPAEFFARTVITEGMGLLLSNVARRLNGEGGDPVVQLQTAFGGGKTHTLLAVLHLARAEVPAKDLVGVPEVLDRAKVRDLPRGRVAVLDGNALSPSVPRDHGSVTANTLWGELAWQLGKEDGYAIVAAADADGTSPGKETLAELLSKFGPAVVLMDEVVAYLRQFAAGKSYRGGTYDSNLSFIQALTEAASGVPNSMVLASLPESMMEVGDQRGREALDSLQKYFGRIEAVWKPVATEEAFEIVRRRLFGPVRDEGARDATCRAFAELYRQEATSFPPEVREAGYEERLRASYPIHPEVFERLYGDWSTLPKFQRTRGVLRLMARVIQALWREDNRDFLILPGSIPLDEPDVRSELVKYLDGQWEPIVERDIDGPNAEPRRLDDSMPNLGSQQACRRAARTIFLGSAPSVREQQVRGLSTERVYLGCAQPGQSVGRYGDALHHLTNRLHYLYKGNERYWFDLRTNLRREMEGRRERFDEQDFQDELRRRLSREVQKGLFDAVHVFVPSGDITDNEDLRLVVLPPSAPHKRKDRKSRAIDVATETLMKRGEDGRSHQNRLLFLAADYDVVSTLRDQTKRYLAWKSIVADADELNLDRHHERQAKESLSEADRRVAGAVTEAYKWLLAPAQELSPQGQLGEVFWEEATLPGGQGNTISAITKAALDNEWLVTQWAPVHLASWLERLYWKTSPHCDARRVWQDSCKYLYLPRLTRRVVFEETIQEGIRHEDWFGYADAHDESTGYKGLLFGREGKPYLTEGALLVTPAAARADIERKRPSSRPPQPQPGPAGHAPGGGGMTGGGSSRGFAEKAVSAPSPGPKRFYASIELDAMLGLAEYKEINDNVIAHLVQKLGANVTVRLDIEATHPDGFDTTLQRTVRENANTLGFATASFEDE